jgi:hypothetical protein
LTFVLEKMDCPADVPIEGEGATRCGEIMAEVGASTTADMARYQWITTARATTIGVDALDVTGARITEPRSADPATRTRRGEDHVNDAIEKRWSTPPLQPVRLVPGWQRRWLAADTRFIPRHVALLACQDAAGPTSS